MHRDLPFSQTYAGERSFPTIQMGFTSVASGTTYQGTYAGHVGSNDINALLCAKEVTIPTGLAGVYGFRDYLSKDIRVGYFAEGSNVRTLGSPLMTPSGTALAGSALEITYVLMERV